MQGISTVLFVNISAHFLKFRKWRGNFQPSLPNCRHDKIWKNVILSLETNMIQPMIKYYYTNIVINHCIIPFYFTSDHKYYFPSLLHLLRYQHNTCQTPFSEFSLILLEIFLHCHFCHITSLIGANVISIFYTNVM